MTETLLDNTNDSFDPNKDWHTELVGEGRKYKDNQALARSKAEADITIRQRDRALDELRAEHNRLREEYNAAQSMRELLDQMKTTTNSPASSDEPPVNTGMNIVPALKPEDVESLVATQVQRLEASKREADNYNNVKAKLEETYGSDYKTFLSRQMDDLGMTASEVDTMARTNPKVFMRTFGLEQNSRETFNAPPRTERRSDTFVPKTAQRTWSYYQNLKKTNPKLYYDPKINNQMLADIKTIGEDAFYDA